MDTGVITTQKLFIGTSIAANTSLTLPDGAGIDLRRAAPNGVFSVYFKITGDGTAKVEYLLSSEEYGPFIEPSSASDVTTGQTKTSGPGSDGIDLVVFQPEIAPFMKIKITETGTASAITPNLWLNMQ